MSELLNELNSLNVIMSDLTWREGEDTTSVRFELPHVEWRKIEMPKLSLRQRIKRQIRMLPDRFRAFADPNGWNLD